MEGGAGERPCRAENRSFGIENIELAANRAAPDRKRSGHKARAGIRGPGKGAIERAMHRGGIFGLTSVLAGA